MDDQIAGIVCRMFPDPTSEATRAEVRALMRGLTNNQPDILREWRPTREQCRFAAEAGGAWAGGGALNIGEKTHGALLRFGARAAAALHFEATKKVLPSTGAILAAWYTNERLINGDFPTDFADMLPPLTTLGAGTQRTLNGQFEYTTRVADDGTLSLHMMTFRLSFAVQAAVSVDADSLNEIAVGKPECVFRPGFLKEKR